MASRDLDAEIAEYISQATPRIETPPGTSVTREVPTRAPSITGDVWAPFLIALITALVVFLSVGTLAIVAAWPVKVPLLVAGAALLFVWLGHLSKGWDRLIWAVEEISGVDVNQDGEVGQPGDWAVSLIDDQGEVKRLLFDSSDQRIHAIAAARLVVQGTPFSEAALTGTGRPLSRTEFHRFRDQLFQRGYAYWKDPGQHTLGIGFTVAGARAMRTLANFDTTQARIHTQRGTQVLPAQVGEGRGDG